MPDFKEAAEEFLAQKNIAVVGVSRSEGTANLIYRTLRKEGYQVFAVNPNAEVVEGDPCYPNLKSIPSPVDGVFVVTRPSVADAVVRECAEIGVTRFWMHENGFAGANASSVSESAVTFGREQGITMIAGGCPMMFLEFGHKCMRWILGIMGRLP